MSDETLAQAVERLHNTVHQCGGTWYNPRGAAGIVAVQRPCPTLALLAEHGEQQIARSKAAGLTGQTSHHEASPNFEAPPMSVEAFAPECDCQWIPAGSYNGESTRFEQDSTYCSVHGGAPESSSDVTEDEVESVLLAALDAGQTYGSAILAAFYVTRRNDG